MAKDTTKENNKEATQAAEAEGGKKEAKKEAKQEKQAAGKGGRSKKDAVDLAVSGNPDVGLAGYTPRLKTKYEEFKVNLQKELNKKNVMEVPRLTKIVVNMGQGEAAQNIKVLESALTELTLISGQKPRSNRSKKSIAGFKLRAGVPIGCSVTLRGRRMYEFFDRLINIATPRIRDFRGFSAKAFDGRGNYSLGIREHIIFPEIDYDKVDKIKGLGVTICTTAETDIEAKALLEKFDFPFRK